MNRLCTFVALVVMCSGHVVALAQVEPGTLATTQSAEPETPSQEPTLRNSRYRVGIALSGGAALGLAHIGVIRYFEEHRIPIDVIAGTSMGGLVGGLYATGLNSSELSDIAEHADWDMLLSATPQYRDRPIAEKQSWNQSFGNLTLRLGRRFSLPQGINPGEALSLLLSRNTAAYGDMSSFDDLPTPFRCVATDLIKAEPVVLSQGSLAKAMRATMALPAIFTPVRWEDKLLVDGALVENLPVEEVRSMGAEKTIAVILKGTTPEAKELNSLSSIAFRSITVAIENNEKRSAKLADIVIAVDTSKFTAADFARSRDLIQAGYDAAQARSAELKGFELSPAEWDAYLAYRRNRVARAPHAAPVVAVTAKDPAFRKDARDELGRKLGRGPVLESDLESTLSGIVAATGVPGASFQWERREKGYRVEFLERTGESILIRPSFNFSISPGEPSQAALQLSVSHIGADAYKSRVLAALTVGYDPGLRLEYYSPLGGTGYFFAPGVFVQRTNINTYSGATRMSQVRDRFGGSFHAGMGTWRFTQVRVGLRAGYDSYSSELANDGLAVLSEAFAEPEVAWIYNTHDSGGLPYRGTKIEGSAGYSFRGRSFPYLRNDVTSFGPFSRYVSWVGTGQVATAFGQKLNVYNQFTSGGAGQLTAFRYQEFHANNLFTAGGGLIFHAPPVRRLSVYPGFAILYEVGRLDLGTLGWQTHQSTTTGLFFPTPLGAAGFAVSFNEAGKARFRVSLGVLGRRYTQ